MAMNIWVEVMRQVGIPISVGIGQSKAIAKYASRLAKKIEGVKVLSGTNWQSLTKEIA